jgi:uncharacterized membrane protein
MASEKSMADGDAYGAAHPIVRTISMADLKESLTKGIADFGAMPTHVVFLCLVYPIVTLIFARTYAGYEMLPLVFPLLAGYTLIGPFVATGMYELSRRREAGLDISRGHAFGVLRSPSIGAIVTLGIVLMAIYFAWLLAAAAIYKLYFGSAVPSSVGEFVNHVFNTPAGWNLIIVGSGVGFIFAAVVLTLSVVSFPMLVDRNVSVGAAVQTSIRAVLANPVTMAIWGVVVAAALLLGSLPVFVGLAVVMPVLGHASWHLYRKVVER